MADKEAKEVDLREAMVRAIAEGSGWTVEDDIDNAREAVDMVMPVVRSFCYLKSGFPWDE
jgi:hypothetical protein